MRRRRIRKTIVFLSFLLFPVTIYFFSPYLIVMSAAHGVISGSALTFAALFVLSLFLRRAGCGWFCPVGGLQNCCEGLTDKRLSPVRPSRSIKYVTWALWPLSIVTLLIVNGVRKVDPLCMNDHSLPLLEMSGYIKQWLS